MDRERMAETGGRASRARAHRGSHRASGRSRICVHTLALKCLLCTDLLFVVLLCSPGKPDVDSELSGADGGCAQRPVLGSTMVILKGGCPKGAGREMHRAGDGGEASAGGLSCSG